MKQADQETKVVGVPMDAELLSRVDQTADREHRNRAQMCRVLIIESLERRDVPLDGQ